MNDIRLPGRGCRSFLHWVKKRGSQRSRLPRASGRRSLVDLERNAATRAVSTSGEAENDRSPVAARAHPLIPGVFQWVHRTGARYLQNNWNWRWRYTPFIGVVIAMRVDSRGGHDFAAGVTGKSVTTAWCEGGQHSVLTSFAHPRSCLRQGSYSAMQRESQR